MVVLREPGEVFLLRHTAGDDAVSLGRADRPRHARTRRAVTRACPADRPGRAGMAAHANGSLHVVFGNHAHRLGPDLVAARHPRAARASGRTTASSCSPDGHLVTKDFGGSLPGQHRRRAPRPAELLVLEPDDARHRRARLDAARAVDRAALGRRRRRLRRGRHDAVPRHVGRHARSRSTTTFAAAVPHASTARATAGMPCIAARRGVVPRRRRGQRALRRHVPRPGASRPRRCTSCGSTSTTGAVTLTEICGLPLGSSPTRRVDRRSAGSPSDTTAATACSPRSTSRATARSHRWSASSGPRVPPARCSPTPASSSPATTTPRRWPTSRRPRHRDRARSRRARRRRQPRAVGRVPRRGLRPRPVLLLVHDPHPRHVTAPDRRQSVVAFTGCLQHVDFTLVRCRSTTLIALRRRHLLLSEV